jgi:hypothetical protein
MPFEPANNDGGVCWPIFPNGRKTDLLNYLLAPSTKSLGALALLFVTLLGCSEKPPSVASRSPAAAQAALPDGLQSYFEACCDDTGSLGIGFVAWHTYDYRFRQYLKRTQDPELKRLYVLENLHRDTGLALNDLQKGIIRTGKSSSRPLTAAEWQAAHESILQQIEDLGRYTTFTNYATTTRDPMDSPDPHLMFWVQDLRETLRSITNAPGANPQRAANVGQPIGPETDRTPGTAAPRRSP